MNDLHAPDTMRTEPLTGVYREARELAEQKKLAEQAKARPDDEKEELAKKNQKLEKLLRYLHDSKAQELHERGMTTQVGKDPSRWFGHVEVMAQDVIGNETVRYVGNILNHLIAYRSALTQDPEFTALLWAEELEEERTRRLRLAFGFIGWVLAGLLLLGVLSLASLWLERRRECCPDDNDPARRPLLVRRLW